MALVEHVPVSAVNPRAFEHVLSPHGQHAWIELIRRAAPALRGRVIWNVNSTAKGGGVVELLRPLLSYARGAGVDARWVVISADAVDDQPAASSRRA